jgi:hypothetical protein
MHPRVSSVLYITSAGGPTLVLEQTPQQGVGTGAAAAGAGAAAAGAEGCDDDARLLAHRAWLVRPASNRLLLFQGDLLHGVLSGSRGGGAGGRSPSSSQQQQQQQQQQERTTIIIAWWGPELQASLEGRQACQEQAAGAQQPGPCMARPFRRGAPQGSGPAGGRGAGAQAEAGVEPAATAAAHDCTAPWWLESLAPVELGGGAAQPLQQHWHSGAAVGGAGAAGSAGGGSGGGGIVEVAPAWERVEQQQGGAGEEQPGGQLEEEEEHEEEQPADSLCWRRAGEVLREAAQLVGRPLQQLMPRLQFFLGSGAEIRGLYVPPSVDGG